VLDDNNLMPIAPLFVVCLILEIELPEIIALDVDEQRTPSAIPELAVKVKFVMVLFETVALVVVVPELKLIPDKLKVPVEVPVLILDIEFPVTFTLFEPVATQIP